MQSATEIITVIKQHLIENFHLYLEPQIQNCITIVMGPRGSPSITWERRQDFKQAVDECSFNIETHAAQLDTALTLVEKSLSEFMEHPMNSGKFQLILGRGNINATWS
jgi:hypothetical protein